jgi:hypothetical protein
MLIGRHHQRGKIANTVPELPQQRSVSKTKESNAGLSAREKNQTLVCLRVRERERTPQREGA